MILCFPVLYTTTITIAAFFFSFSLTPHSLNHQCPLQYIRDHRIFFHITKVPTLFSLTPSSVMFLKQAATTTTSRLSTTWHHTPRLALTTVRRLHAEAAASGKEAYIEHLSGDQTGIAVLKLNRPKARNALSVKLLGEFREALEEVRFKK